jgi:hypothetical protein
MGFNEIAHFCAIFKTCGRFSFARKLSFIASDDLAKVGQFRLKGIDCYANYDRLTNYFGFVIFGMTWLTVTIPVFDGNCRFSWDRKVAVKSFHCQLVFKTFPLVNGWITWSEGKSRDSKQIRIRPSPEATDLQHLHCFRTSKLRSMFVVLVLSQLGEIQSESIPSGLSWNSIGFFTWEWSEIWVQRSEMKYRILRWYHVLSSIKWQIILGLNRTFASRTWWHCILCNLRTNGISWEPVGEINPRYDSKFICQQSHGRVVRIISWCIIARHFDPIFNGRLVVSGDDWRYFASCWTLHNRVSDLRKMGILRRWWI